MTPRSAMAPWISIAHRVASTALANSTSSAVAGRLDEAATMLCNFWLNQFAANGPERCERTLFVEAHKTAITDDVCR